MYFNLEYMKLRDLVKMVKDDGWYEVRVNGRHRQFHHPVKKELLQLQEVLIMMFQKEH